MSRCFTFPLGPEGNAASAVGEFGMAVLLNSDNGRRQRTFDLAHELYHLLTWQSRGNRDAPETAEEITADRFAAHLLVPFSSLAEAMESIPQRAVSACTATWPCSPGGSRCQQKPSCGSWPTSS